MPGENLIGERGQGPEDRPHHAEHRPPGAAGDLRRRRRSGRPRSRASGRPSASSGASRSASTTPSRRRSPSSPPRAFGLEAMLDVASRLADDKRNDIRIEAAIAKLYALRAGLEGGRRADAGPRRPRLRDRRVAEGARREAGPGRAGAARHAHQPHLRGLDRDHAPADRARGGRPAPAGGRRASSRATATCSEKAERGRRRPARSTRKWLPKLAVGEGTSPSAFDEFGELATHLRYVERSSRRLARSTFYAMGRWQAKLEQRQAVPRPDRRHRRRAVRDLRRRASTPTRSRREQPERAAERDELADLFCRQARRRADALFDSLWSTTTTTTHYELAQERARRPLHAGSRRASSTRRASSAGRRRPGRTPCGCARASSRIGLGSVLALSSGVPANEKRPR